MNQPTALFLADVMHNDPCSAAHHDAAAFELRRLHAENQAIRQAITDPENQPSQFGTVTLTMYEAMEAQRDALLDEIQTHSAAVYECTRLLAEAREQRDALLGALKLARSIIGHPDDAHTQMIDAAIKAVEGEKE